MRQILIMLNEVSKRTLKPGQPYLLLSTRNSTTIRNRLNVACQHLKLRTRLQLNSSTLSKNVTHELFTHDSPVRSSAVTDFYFGGNSFLAISAQSGFILPKYFSSLGKIIFLQSSCSSTRCNNSYSTAI